MPGCGLWAARPAARVRRWRPRTKEACSCTHGTTSSIEGRGGRSPARSGNAFRELGADPYTTTKDLDFPEGPVLLRIAVRRYRFPVRKHASIFATARCAAGRPHNYHTASAPVPRAPTSHMPPPTTSLPQIPTLVAYIYDTYPVATGWQPYTEPYTPPRAFIHAPNVKVPRPHAYRHARPPLHFPAPEQRPTYAFLF